MGLVCVQQLNLKNQLHFYLRELGITASQLARKAGIPRSSISDWQAGTKPRNIADVKNVATALGTTLDNLCFGDGAEPKQSSDPFESAFGDGWFGGLFEIRVRRIKRDGR
jgi:transcriptional regulator with XRE-family HTH domain